MSGPIIRKYGFPNFDQIFGKKELEHGVEDEASETGASREPKSATEVAKKSDQGETKPGGTP